MMVGVRPLSENSYPTPLHILILKFQSPYDFPWDDLGLANGRANNE